MITICRSWLVLGLISAVVAVPACKEKSTPAPVNTNAGPNRTFNADPSEVPRFADENEAHRPEFWYFDLGDLLIELNDIKPGGPLKDGIPALINPERIAVTEAAYPDRDARVAEVVIDGQAVAYPLGILNYHEIANDVVGGVPVAVTYCPLCDSVSVFDRRIDIATESGEVEQKTLAFGVSGLLCNSNVLMYDRTSLGLWSQVAMKCVSGVYSGRTLDMLPVRMSTFGEFQRAHPDGEVLTTRTGVHRTYDINPYRSYFGDQKPLYEFGYDDRLPPKTLGLGIVIDAFVAFVPASHVEDEPLDVQTPAGVVRLESNEAGMRLIEAPPGTMTIQTFYHSWSAFHPQTIIINDRPEG